MNSNEQQVKGDFLKWIATWMFPNEPSKNVPFCQKSVVQLLQALGFTIKRIDYPGINNGNGLGIVLTCPHSGQRCVMELATKTTDCDCHKSHLKNDNAFLQAVGDDVSGFIPTISNEQNDIIKNVFGYFISNVIPTKCYENRYKNGLEVKVDSPTRYRSLDTLTSEKNDSVIPEPGRLVPKIVSEENLLMKSSPNITVSDSKVNLVLPKILSHVKTAMDSLTNAEKLIKSHRSQPSPTSVIKVPLKSTTLKPTTTRTALKPISTPNIPVASSTSIPKPAARLPLKSTSSVSSSVTSSYRSISRSVSSINTVKDNMLKTIKKPAPLKKPFTSLKP